MKHHYIGYDCQSTSLTCLHCIPGLASFCIPYREQQHVTAFRYISETEDKVHIVKACLLLLNRNMCYIVYICPVAGSIADEAAMEIPAAVVAYHYPCHDGIFAALAAHLHFAATGAAVRFVPNRVFAPCTVQDLQLQVRV